MIGPVFLAFAGFGLATFCAAGAVVGLISWNLAPIGSDEEHQMLRLTLSLGAAALLLGGGASLVLGQ